MRENLTWKKCKNIIFAMVTAVLLVFFLSKDALFFFADDVAPSGEESTEFVTPETEPSTEESTSSAYVDDVDPSAAGAGHGVEQTPKGGDDPTPEGETEASPEGGSGGEGEPETEAESESESESETSDGEDVPEEMTGVVWIYYFGLDEEEESETFGQIIEKTAKYASVEEAFADVSALRTSVRELDSEYEGYNPELLLVDDCTLTTSINVAEDGDWGMNFLGHTLTLAEGCAIHYGDNHVRLYDSSVPEMSYTENNYAHGGMVANTEAMLIGDGEILVLSGYYRNTNGFLFRGGAITTYGGFFLADVSVIADQVTGIYVNGGFFAFNGNETAFVPLEGKAMGAYSILLNESEIAGYLLCEPEYKISVSYLEGAENPDLVFYGVGFADTFQLAMKKSSEHGGAIATIEIISDSIPGVNIGQNYHISAGEYEYAPCIELKGMNIKRGLGYDGGFFTVASGRLILTDCHVNAYISEEEKSVASLITVESGAVLQLRGRDAATTLELNNAMLIHEDSDPGAAIYVKSGGSIWLSGNVGVRNSTVYHMATESYESYTMQSNLFLAEGANLVLKGVLNGSEGSIGISYADDPEDEMLLANVDAAVRERFASDEEAQNATVQAFLLDGYASYKASYNAETGQIVWARNKALLPETGIIRVEIIILILGFFGFILTMVPVVRQREDVLRYITTLSLICLVVGAVLGMAHYRTQRQALIMGQRAVGEMTGETSGQKYKKVSSLFRQGEEEESSEVQETEPESTAAALHVPNDGRDYYGILEIPELEMSIPVLAGYSEADLKTMPCVYYGCRENNDLVISGHNYNTQFGEINHVNGTITAKLTQLDGSVSYYVSTGMESLNPDQVDEMVSGDWDMTLFTCSFSGDKRVAVRFELQ